MSQKPGNNYSSLGWTGGDFMKLERKSQVKARDSGGYNGIACFIGI